MGNEKATLTPEDVPVVTVETADSDIFERRCAELLGAGYKMKTCSCGFVNSESYDFCASWQAIFIYEQ